MKKMKIGKLVVLLATVIGLCLTGCGNAAGTSADTLSGDLSRASYIGLLGNSFGYNDYVATSDYFSDVNASMEEYTAIQACAEWEVIDSSGSFDPNGTATLEFALNSAVRAIGVDLLTTAGKAVDEDLAQFYVNNIASVDYSNPSKAVDYETAQQIIDCAMDYRNSIELPQVCNVAFADDVITDSTGLVLLGDGQTARVESGASFNVGDVIYLAPTNTSTAQAIKVVTTGDGYLTYATVPAENVFTEFEVSGTYDANVIDVARASDSVDVCFGNGDGTMTSIVGVNATPVVTEDIYLTEVGNGVNFSKDTGSNYAKFTISFDQEGEDSNGHAEVVVGIENIKVTTDVKISPHLFSLPTVDKAYANVSFDTIIEGSAEGHIGKEIPLGKIKLNIGSTPLNVELQLIANIGADGDISITYKNVVNASVKYNGSSLSKDVKVDSSLDIHSQVTLTAEATGVVSLKALDWNLVNVQVTSGVVGIATADIDLLNGNPACVDLLVYVPLRWGVNQQECLLTKISSKLKYEATVWDSENSEVRWHWHFEDGTEVGECTRGEGEQIETPSVDENGNPYEEYNLFEFEKLDFGFIETDGYNMFLDPGTSGTIGFVSLPEGYSASDLTYEVVDPSICSVNGGNVTANNSGVTLVIIRTNDGMYSSYMTVVVATDYSVEGGFEQL